MTQSPLDPVLDELWERRADLSPADEDARKIVIAAVDQLDAGEARVAQVVDDEVVVDERAKRAILLRFKVLDMVEGSNGGFYVHDRVPLKPSFPGVRVVAGAIARWGSHFEPGVVLMPSYTNIGGYVGSGSMVDTWATVGSCAQVGRDVHLAGGVGIGGVLEPPQATPTIIEDGAFIGSRCVVVEGVVVEEEAVLGAGVVLTASTQVVDVSGPEPVVSRGRIPARSVVIPGSRPKEFPAGTFHVPCALIVGQRQESTDRKTSLNDVLRTFDVQV